MKGTRLLVAMLAVLLIGAVSTVASNTAKEKQAAAAKTPAVKMHVATGQVVSISDTTLVLSHKVKGKMEQTSYTLTSETKREGTVESGAKATVHYKMESGQELATLVKVKPAKAAKAATHKP